MWSCVRVLQGAVDELDGKSHQLQALDRKGFLRFHRLRLSPPGNPFPPLTVPHSVPVLGDGQRQLAGNGPRSFASSVRRQSARSYQPRHKQRGWGSVRQFGLPAGAQVVEHLRPRFQAGTVDDPFQLRSQVHLIVMATSLLVIQPSPLDRSSSAKTYPPRFLQPHRAARGWSL